MVCCKRYILKVVSIIDSDGSNVVPIIISYVNSWGTNQTYTFLALLVYYYKTSILLAFKYRESQQQPIARPLA